MLPFTVWIYDIIKVCFKWTVLSLLRNKLLGSLVEFLYFCFLFLLCAIFVHLYYFVSFIYYLVCHYIQVSLYFSLVVLGLLSSSVLSTDPSHDCKNVDTKPRFWGFASCIVSMCLFCSFSSPLPQYDSRWWLSPLLSWCRSDVTHSLAPPLSPSSLPSFSSAVYALLICVVWCFICIA